MSMRVFSLTLFLCGLTIPSWALTVSWNCNTELDMKEYRLEYTKNGGAFWGVEATVPHKKPCVSPVSIGITRYLEPGDKQYRVFSIDSAGNSALPSEPASYTVKPGSATGQVEVALPASPYKVTPSPPAPPAPPAPPPPPSIVNPSAITNFAVTKGPDPNSVVIALTVPDDGTGHPAKIDVRRAPSPMRWGSATSLTCLSFPCTVQGVPTGLPQDFQAIAFRSTPQGSVFSDFTPVGTLTLSLPPDPGPTLQEALQVGIAMCLSKNLTLRACLQTLQDRLGKVDP